MRAPAALALAVLALSACGPDPKSNKDQIRDAVGDYAAAVDGENPKQVCDVLVTPKQLDITAAARKRDRDRCRDRVGDGRLEAGQSLEGVRVKSVRVRGARAAVRLASGEAIELRRIDGHWRILTPG